MPSPERLANDFTYHPPSASQIPIYELVRARGLEMASFLNGVCPDSRELSLALTNLEQTVFWANAAIARAPAAAE